MLTTIQRSINLGKFLKLTASPLKLNNLPPLMCQVAFTFTSSSAQSQTAYTQRAYSPSYMSQLLIQQLSTSQSSSQIMHQLSLYHSKILTFDYDYFTQSLKRLISYQQKLTMQEILMLFDLAVEYKIDSLILQTQFMNEIHCRLYLAMKKELNGYDKELEAQVTETYQRLEKLSKDHFGIIQEKFREIMEDKNQNQEGNDQQDQQTEHQLINSQLSSNKNTPNKITNKPIYNAGQRKGQSRRITQHHLAKITTIFLQSNSKNVEFNRLLLQVHTTRLDQTTSKETSLTQLSAEYLLLYTRLAVNLLQLYMSEYQAAMEVATKNKPSIYTHRSVKNVYKLQHFYYYEVAKLIEEKKLLTTATNQQFVNFLEVIAGFPIKRRSFRKAIGEVLIEETIRRSIDSEELVKFFQLSKYDNKLLQHFESKINEGKELSQSSKPLIEQNQSEEISSQASSALTPDVIIDLESPPTQTLFKMPSSLLRKVTKKKSKPKSKKLTQSQEQIDLTQQDQQIVVQEQKTTSDKSQPTSQEQNKQSSQ